MPDLAPLSRDNLPQGASPETDVASVPFVGLWNRLVSRTNWDKGRIICEWREALVAAGAPATDYSDEAWAERVGGVSGQHVGRLRRVYLRFGETSGDYDRLFWSHFYAALDWSDAEMWLEGAVQNKWSVSQMRGQRWETLGSPEDLKPRDEEINASDDDEDALELAETQATAGDGQIAGVKPASGEDDFEPSGASEPSDADDADASSNHASDYESAPSAAADPDPPVRPFAGLPDLPDDLAEAFEQFKVAILSHKLDEWQEVSCDDVLQSLDALKALALAPPGESS